MEIYFDGTLIDSDNYISFTNEFKQFDESFMLGTTASNTITIEVPGNISIPTNVLIKINNSNYSTMIVDSYEYEDNNILKLNLVDKMVLLDFNYNAKSLVPCTVKQILQDICTQAGITLATTTFTNQNLSVDYYDNTITAREYVGMIAELNGGFARINTSGALELVKFTGTPTNIDIDTCEDFRVGEKHKIERVVFDNGLLKFETSSDETKETLYLNSQNVYINDETTFNNIANQILNFEFYCFSTGNCEIKSNVRAGDLLNFTDGTNNYPTIAQYSLNYVGGLNGGYELNINSKKQEETKIVGVGEQYKRLSVKIDRDKNEILETVESQISGVEKEINPTDTSSNSSIYLEDSAEAELIDFELEGKTTQETRSGINLLNVNASSSTINGITFTVNKDKSITINGTNTGSTSWFRLSPNLVLPSGTYTLSNGNNNVSNNTFIFIDDGSHFDRTNISSKTFSVDTTIAPYIKVSAGTTINNQTIYPMIVEGSYTSETMPNYEQYGIMPSPDYPSELVSVGYENLFDKDNINVFYGYVNASNVITSSSGSFSIYVPCEPNTTYTIQKNGGTVFSLAYCNQEPTNDGTAYGRVLNNTATSLTITTGNEAKYLISLICATNASNRQEIIDSVQIQKGAQQHSYIPYGKYGIEVETIGKNSFSGFVKEIGLTSSNGNQTTNANAATSDFIKVDFNTNSNYYLSGLSGTLTSYVASYNSNKEFLGRTPATHTLKWLLQTNSFTGGTPQGTGNIAYLRITQYKQSSDTSSIDDVDNLQTQLEIGDVATDYEEHKSNTYLYTLDNPLRSIGDIKDLLYIKNGMLYVERKIGSVVLDGSENWLIPWDVNYVYMCSNALTNAKKYSSATKNIICKSNYYPATHHDGGAGSMWNLRNNENYPYLISIVDHSTNAGKITIKNVNITTSTDFKTWLSTHNTEVQYILAEPYTEELGEVQIPSTYKGITHIDTIDELEPNMNITYVRDTLIANYVESHISELKINEQGIEARVETIEESDYGGQISELSGSLDSQEARLDVISTNIDTTTGEVREVTTSNGLKFNSQGLNLYTGQDSYNTLINNVGTYYKDGDNVISETTKDGFMATNSKNKGQHSYSYDETNDLYEFIDERVEADGEYCYATFYNGEE
jgi:hypothetical protein